MTVEIQGFVSIPALADNASESTSDIGEISIRSRTYARDKQYCSIDSAPGIELIIFKALDGDTEYRGIDNVFTQEVLELLYDIKENFDNTETLTNYLTENAPDTFSSFSYDDIIVKDDCYLPESISFKHTNSTTEVETEYQLWLSDEKFSSEYEGVELVVVPPVTDIDTLFTDYDTALAAVNAVTYIEQITAVESAKGDYPYTQATVYELKWNDASDVTQQFTTNWTILGYGESSTRTDYMLEAIQDYITTNSEYSLDEWEDYLPDITTINVFTIIPLWDRVALEAGSSVDSMYCPCFDIGTITTVGPKITVGRTSDEYTSLSEQLVVLYKYMPVLCMPGSSNETDVMSFIDLFGDYTIITLNDQNASRVSAATQEVISVLDTLVRAAETDDGTSDLATGISRNYISGITFLEKSANDIVFRVVTQESYLETV